MNIIDMCCPINPLGKRADKLSKCSKKRKGKMSNHNFDNQVSADTYLCHGPFDPEVFGGVVNPPVYHASTVIFKNCKELSERHQALFEDAEDEIMYYGRFGTPTTFAVQKRWLSWKVAIAHC
jgi:cystathionine beta-lyase/cystathionine gamma-synthase